jgi:hypothetical protein
MCSTGQTSHCNNCSVAGACRVIVVGLQFSEGCRSAFDVCFNAIPVDVMGSNSSVAVFSSRLGCYRKLPDLKMLVETSPRKASSTVVLPMEFV